jgi:hypothetical protein
MASFPAARHALLIIFVHDLSEICGTMWLCVTIPSVLQVACSAVDGTPQRTAIEAAWEAFPLRGSLPTSAQAPTVAATLTFGNSSPAPGPAQVPDSAPTDEHDANTTVSSGDPVGSSVPIASCNGLLICSIVPMILCSLLIGA